MDMVDVAADIQGNRLAAGAGHCQSNDRNVLFEYGYIGHMRRIDVDGLIVRVLKIDQRHMTLLFLSWQPWQ
ncbi:MAG: hypothetical protein BGN83_07130 [Rhizobium sp. 63-7]|nr:MAG: hypothetical protein BGN83_07130 [Rhizobium sp. 63-7]